MEAGLDSLGAVELRNALSARYKLDLPASLLFDYPSISALSSYLSDTLGTAAAVPTFPQPAETSETSQFPGAEVLAISCQYPTAREGKRPNRLTKELSVSKDPSPDIVFRRAVNKYILFMSDHV